MTQNPSDAPHNTRTISVGAEEAGERLDRLLSLHFTDLSRSRFKDLIKQGQAAANGRTIIEPNYRVKPDDEISITVPPAEDPIPKGEDIPLDVIYEDDALIVLNKPAGMVAHPAAGNWHGTLVNALIAHCGDSLSGIGGVKRPGIVHRLDKDTSGVMVVAKTDEAHRGLSEQFAAHGRDGRMTRAYEALVWGSLERQKGSIDAALGRSNSNRLKIAVTSEERGRHAITHYEALETLPHGADIPVLSHVRCVLETGRTHQIRVHMAHIGHPLLGDETYGAHFAASANKLPEAAKQALKALKRQALHAAHLGFDHPVTGEPMRFDAPLPEDIARLLKTCE
ncbi:MAG: RluA family pseudouridine synthase [Hyphomicrobiales bacterium]